MKIHLIGAPGSGKSYAAAHLSAQFRLPVLDLDSLVQHTHTPVLDSDEDSPARTVFTLSVLAAFIENPCWIVTGTYFPGLLASLQKANHIIALTTPLSLRQTRLVRTFLIRKLIGDSRAYSLRCLRDQLTRSRNYDRDQFPAMHALLVRQDLPYARCTTLAEVLAAAVSKPAPLFTPIKARAYRWHA